MASAFNVPMTMPAPSTLQRTHVALLVERVPRKCKDGEQVEVPRLPTWPAQVAYSNSPSNDANSFFAVDPSVSQLPFKATYPNLHGEACPWLDFIADSVETLVGSGQAHVKLAWPHTYSRTNVVGTMHEGVVAINTAACDKTASVVVLVVVPPGLLRSSTLEFCVPQGLRVSTHSAHDSHPLFMEAWRAIADHEFVIAQGSPSKQGIWPRASPFVPALPRQTVPLDPLMAHLKSVMVPGEPGAYRFVFT